MPYTRTPSTKAPDETKTAVLRGHEHYDRSGVILDVHGLWPLRRQLRTGQFVG